MSNDDPLQANTYTSARRRHILQGGSASMLLALGAAYTGWSNAAVSAAGPVPNQDPRMKIILCSRRHPSMTRAEGSIALLSARRTFPCRAWPRITLDGFALPAHRTGRPMTWQWRHRSRTDPCGSYA